MGAVTATAAKVGDVPSYRKSGQASQGSGSLRPPILHTELPHDPAIPLPGVHPHRAENRHSNKYTYMFGAADSEQPKRWKQPKWPPTDERLHKTWSVHTPEYCADIKRNEVMPRATT